MKPTKFGKKNPKVGLGIGLRALAAGVVCMALGSPSWASAPPLSKVRPPESSDVKYKLSDEALQEEGRDPAEIKGPRPIIKPETESHDFGPVWVGPDLKYEFTIKNEGEADLEILSVKPSCGCTIAGNYPRKLGAGESGKFPFAMKSEKLRGNFAKHITITSNDPVNPRLQLTLRGEVKRFVEVTPSSASFGRITDQKPQTRELAIINNTDKPLTLELDTKDAKAFEYKLEEKEPGKRYALLITTKPPFGEGRVNEGIVLKTNLDEQKEIEVRSMAAVPARLEVQPESVIINAQAAVDKSAQPISRVLRFTNYGETPAKLLEATVDDPMVAAVIREREEGEAYTIEVTMPAGYEPPAQGRTITLKTDDPQIPKIEVPIRLIGRPQQDASAQSLQRTRPEDMVGKPIPAFSLETVDGKKISNDQIQEAVTVLNFYAPNCGFCKKQIPRLETVRQKYESHNVRFVNVTQKMGAKEFTKEEIIDQQKELGFRGDIALNLDNSVGRLFNVTGFPSMFVIGKDGKVAAATSGNAADLESKVSGQIDALLSGKPAGGATATQPDSPQQENPKPSHHSAADGTKSVRLASFVQEPAAKPAEAPKQEAAPADKQPALPKVAAPGAQATPPPARIRADTLIGKPAPTMSLKTVGGKDLSNDTFDDAPATVLNFFAGNCGYCKKQIPRLETIRKEYESKGVRFVNVAETMRQEYSEQEILDILKQTGWEGEVARDPKNEFGPPFGASGFPTMVIVGKSGKIEAVNVGNIGDLETRMKGQLDALVEGKPIPSQFVQAPKAADPAAAAKPEDMVGKPIPAFELKTSDGKTVSSAALASKATVLNFFAPNCGFCKKQIPRLETVRKDYAGKPVEFVQVKETMGKEFTDEETIGILKELGLEAPAVAADPANATGKKFNVRGFPTMVVLGNGKVQAVNVGNIGDLETRLKGQLDALIEGKDIAQAPPAPAPGAQAQAQPGAKSAPTDWVGHPAPAFSLKTTDGKSVETGNVGEAKATVLNFFAPNCGFCKKQIPRMETLRKEYEGKPVRFVQVKETMGKEFTDEDAMKTLKEVGWEGDMASDPGNAVGQKFNVRGFPSMIVLGANGKVQAANVGNIADLETKLKAQLDTLLEGKEVAAAPAPPPSPQAAAPKRRPAEEMRGQKAPGFTLTTLDGETVSSQDFAKHKATVLNFVAPNCGFCKKQVPSLEKVRADYEAKGVRFVNMVQKMGTKDFENTEIVDIFKQAGSNLDLAKDEGNKVGTQYKVVSFPTMFVVSSDGTVAEVAIGAKPDLETTLRTRLDELVK